MVLRYFFTSRAAYEKDIEAWSERYTIALVHEGETFDYFVVVTRPGEEVVLDAQEVKAPTMDCRQTEAQIAEARRKLAELDREFSRAALFGGGDPPAWDRAQAEAGRDSREEYCAA